MFLTDGDVVRPVATVDVPAALVEFDKQRGTFQPAAGGGLERVIRTKQVIHIADLASEHLRERPSRYDSSSLFFSNSYKRVLPQSSMYRARRGDTTSRSSSSLSAVLRMLMVDSHLNKPDASDMRRMAPKVPDFQISYLRKAQNLARQVLLLGAALFAQQSFPRLSPAIFELWMLCNSFDLCGTRRLPDIS
jgi:hypothetical protein